jgi:AcrR family transcriptional regulator
MPPPKKKTVQRNKGYDATHREMIETAVRLVSQKGVEAVSVAALARAMGINRTTVYYHFDTREKLLAAVQAWAAEQLSKAFDNHAPQRERIDYTTRFVLENPELIKLWIEDLIAAGDIRTRYPHWDAMVKSIKASAGKAGDKIDAEIYCVILLTSAIIGPRIFKNSVNPEADTETIVRRFQAEQLRLLRQASLARD